MSQIIKRDKKIEDNKQKNKDVKTSNCHENLGNNNYKKDNKVYTFNRDGTITITNSDVFKNEEVKVSINNNINNNNINNNSLNNFRSNYKTSNYQYKNIYNHNTEYKINYNTPINNYTSHPYQDRNNYDDDDYKKDFYHNFSDPWKVRNDVEKNGYTISEFGEVFSPEQIKYYKKFGHDITPDSNFH